MSEVATKKRELQNEVEKKLQLDLSKSAELRTKIEGELEQIGQITVKGKKDLRLKGFVP